MVMQGIAERDRRAMDQTVLAAWWNANLGGVDHLHSPQHYLDMLKPRKPQTADDVLAVFREHEARAPGLFKIRHVGPDGKELN